MLLAEGALVAVIDGLGHGNAAAHAAARAARVVRESPTADLPDLVGRCHAALRGTRGAAISLAFLSPAADALTWLGVGNVEGRVLSAKPAAMIPKGSLALDPGVPGHELPALRPTTLPVQSATSSSWPPMGSAGRSPTALNISGSAQTICERVVAEHWRRPDDAVGGGRALSRGATVSAHGGPGKAIVPRASTRRRSTGIWPTAVRTTLRLAYELGRQAITRALSVLDVVLAHQEALAVSHGRAEDEAGLRRWSGRRATSCWRACPATRWCSVGWRRRSGAVARPPPDRTLSPALDLSRRCLTRARTPPTRSRRCCGSWPNRLVNWWGRNAAWSRSLPAASSGAVEAASYPQGDPRWTTLVRWLDLAAIYRTLREAGGSARSTGEQLVRSALFRATAYERSPAAWLAASLTTLDGGELGAIQLFDADRRGVQRGRRGRTRASGADGLRGTGARQALPARS